MLAEIKNRYKGFGDGLVFEIVYNLTSLRSKGGSKKNIEVFISTLNYYTNERERVKLIFNDVVKFKFFENKQIQSLSIFEAYIAKVNDLIIFDFHALQVDGRELLAEDPDSTFVIHSKEIKYEVTDIPAL